MPFTGELEQFTYVMPMRVMVQGANLCSHSNMPDALRATVRFLIQWTPAKHRCWEGPDCGVAGAAACRVVAVRLPAQGSNRLTSVARGRRYVFLSFNRTTSPRTDAPVRGPKEVPTSHLRRHNVRHHNGWASCYTCIKIIYETT